MYRSPCPTIGTPLGIIREESRTPEVSPPEEALPLSRVLPFSQQWVADDAEPTVRLDYTTGVLAAAGDDKEDVQNEMVRATPVGSFQ